MTPVSGLLRMNRPIQFECSGKLLFNLLNFSRSNRFSRCLIRASDSLSFQNHFNASKLILLITLPINCLSTLEFDTKNAISFVIHSAYLLDRYGFMMIAGDSRRVRQGSGIKLMYEVLQSHLPEWCWDSAWCTSDLAYSYRSAITIQLLFTYHSLFSYRSLFAE